MPKIITEDNVLAQLKTVLDPELNKDLVSLNMIKDIKIETDPSLLRPSDVTLQIPCIDKLRRHRRHRYFWNRRRFKYNLTYP